MTMPSAKLETCNHAQDSRCKGRICPHREPHAHSWQCSPRPCAWLPSDSIVCKPPALDLDLVIVNAGAAADYDWPLPADVRRQTTVVEIDAATGSNSKAEYRRRVVIPYVIAGTCGRVTFRRNTFAGSASILPPDERLVKQYGVERYYTPALRTAEDAHVLSECLSQESIGHVDFLKTDLEGLDLAVITETLTRYKPSVILCELRFQPFYQGEPDFAEAAGFLQRSGYELLDFAHLERWKYAVAGSLWQYHGRAVWADCLWIRKPNELTARERAAQIIVLAMLGYRNYARQLYEPDTIYFDTDTQTLLRYMLRFRFPPLRDWPLIVRRWLRPVELFAKQVVYGYSRHVSLRKG